MDPLVSIVISLFDKEDFIVQAVRSALDQSYTNIEVIVVDDGSTDRSLQRLMEVSDPRWRLITHSGAGKPRPAACKNRGYQLAKGEFVAFLDADDVWAQSKLETHVRALMADSSACLAYSLTTWIDVAGRTICTESPYDPAPDWYSMLLLEGNILRSGSNAVHRRSMLSDTECFDSSFESASDWDLYLRLARDHSFCLVSEPLVMYRVSESQHSLDLAKMERSILRIVEREYGKPPASLLPKSHRQQCLRTCYGYLRRQCMRKLRNPHTTMSRLPESLIVLAHSLLHGSSPVKTQDARTPADSACRF